jgi:Ca2+-transporting ATPase
LDLKDFIFHQKDVDEVVKELHTDLRRGLSNEEAERRLKQYGENVLEKEEETSLWERIKEAFEDLLVRILLLAAVISLIIAIQSGGEEGLSAYVEPVVILMILLLNAIISIWQDSNADKALEALKSMQPLRCLLLREG